MTIDLAPPSAARTDWIEAPPGLGGEPYARDELLHEIFFESARRYGHRVALRMLAPGQEYARRQSLRYFELRERATRFAVYLRGLGVQRGDRVVICLPRSPDQYMVILGVLAAGAAYVPVDWTFPQDRIDVIVADCAAKAVITLEERAASFAAGVRIVALDAQLGEIAAAQGLPLTRQETGVTPDDLAYIIYTSGSTGRPKGVMIRHRNICHLVRSESAVLELNADDRVFGGFSLAFDMSVETMWSAFFVGAELLIASEAMAKAGPDLIAELKAAEATIWHAVPSLMASIEDDAPTVRLINLGGEACPPELVRRLARPGRRLLNTYGPTETSVTATWTELEPGKPVTIGKPLPGYRAWIVDDAFRPTPPGAEGELIIGGPGVGAGYLNRPELSAEKFIEVTLPPDDQPQLVYRSGDLVRLNADGDIEFLGRMDTQVKIRGYRIELGEIEAILMEHQTVAQAVVQVFQADDGSDLLVGFVTPRTAAGVDIDGLRQTAAAALPAYMRPAHYEVVADLPRMVSGKIDRKALRRPALDLSSRRAVEPPQTPMEAKLVAVWNEVFAPQTVGATDDFFADLGGHSLKAARVVSIARRDEALSSLSIQDLYAAPTVRALAERIESASREAAPKAPPFAHVPFFRRFACVIGQTLALPFIFAFAGAQWITPYIVYTWLVSDDVPRVEALLASGSTFLILPPITMLAGVAVKWLILGRMKPGDYPLWGLQFFRWWLVRRLLGVLPTQFLAGTRLMNAYFRLLGARVGPGAYLGLRDLDAPDMVEIGQDALLSESCIIAATSVERGLFRVGRVWIGARAFVGAQAVVGRGARLGEGSVLQDLSALSPGQTAPAGEIWDGSPAVSRGPVPAERLAKRAAKPSFLASLGVNLGLMSAAAVLPLVAVAPVAPGLIALVELDWATSGYLYIAVTPVLALTYIVLMCALTVAAKWVLLGKVKPGVYPIWSWFYVRYWFVHQLSELALDLIHPIYATLYVRPWYRAMGAKVGARAEISTASAVVHDLVDIGPESFIADGVIFGGARLEPGAIRLDRTAIGRRSFVGNSGLLPAGAAIGDDVLVGVLSKSPQDPKAAMERGATWFGSPPIRFPSRQSVAVFDEGSTFRPSARLIAARLTIEFVRLILPLTVFLSLFSAMLSILGDVADMQIGYWAVLLFPLLYLGFCVSAGATVVALKWLVIGRYKPIVRPLWSYFVWRTELVTSTYENLVAALFLAPLRGTPYLNMYLRLMGCRIGSRAFIDTTDITEFDLVSIGTDAAINEDAGLQTHLFEDRVMKVSAVEIGDRATVGSLAVVLYDAVIEPDAQLGDLSVLMKGERLPTGTCWEGSPAQPARGQD